MISIEVRRQRNRDKMRADYHRSLEIREKRLRSTKEWRLKNPEKVKELDRKKRLFRKFGITVEQYDKILAKQEGVCALCHHPPKNKRLAVDHRHRDGIVRGLLCDGCNRHLGMIEKRFSLGTLFFYLSREKDLRKVA